MVREDSITMSMKELKCVHVIRQVMERRLTQVQAGTLVGLTARHVRRLIQRVEREGDQGLAHRGRGKPSNRQIPEKVKAKALKLYAQRYGDFGPTLAAEKLAERHGIAISAETVRGWLRDAGIDHFTRRKRPHRAWRARKAHPGELIQLDGSHHDWLEGRGPRGVLMAYIDDASSRVSARFYEYEGTIPAMDSFTRYIRQHGIPLALYTDRHTTYRATGEPTVAQQLAGETPQSQFERALAELGVTLIHAHSPQAKGRVERNHGTQQDRLIKKMRLQRIASAAEANQYLRQTYLPDHNRRFRREAASPEDYHRTAPGKRELDAIFRLEEERTISKDWVVRYQGRFLQIERQSRYAPAGGKVIVSEGREGGLQVLYRGQPVQWREIPAPAPRAQPQSAVDRPAVAIRRKRRRPASDHPWKKPWQPRRAAVPEASCAAL